MVIINNIIIIGIKLNLFRNRLDLKKSIIGIKYFVFGIFTTFLKSKDVSANEVCILA